MSKFKRLINKYWVLFCTFFIINIFFIWIVTNILSIEDQLKTEKSLISTEAKTMFFYGGDNVDKEYLLDILKDKKIILESLITPANSKDDVEVRGIYYNYNIDKKYPLLEGRMFTSVEILEKDKVALVGYDLKDKIKNNTIKVENEDYKVIGILGDKKTNAFRNSIYINLNSRKLNLSNRGITIDVANENVSEITNDISQKLKRDKKGDVDISQPYGVSNPLKESLGQNRIHLVLAVLATFCLISTLINVGNYWIDKEKSIIGIKSLVGGTKLSISIKFWMEYIDTIILSLVFGTIVWIIVSAVMGINIMLNFKVFSLLVFVNIVVSTLAFIIPVINLMRLDINSIVKENI